MSSDYGKAFALMRDAAQGPWGDYTRHTFVEGLKDGTLPRAAFLHYLRQDYVFLTHFSRAWALAVVKAQTHDEMQVASATVNGLLHEEMMLHVGVCAEEGITREELFATPERPENLAYTRFVLESGYSGDYLSLLAALLPCVVGYAEIGSRLAQEATSETYRPWIDTYAGEQYQSHCHNIGALLDGALIRRLGENYDALPVWADLCKTFRTATELEVNFWQMGLTP
ncbi:thiaminase II [Ruegeria halocynthiae]|uniref:thiaminase II n=1 Tax=Ruegeria halocynthiae TaxID=985054 RepID=UPI0009DFB02E|nr:thiaminase II [Ruegeria halocynthiae]